MYETGHDGNRVLAVILYQILQQSWGTFFLNAGPPHLYTEGLDCVVQLSRSKAATQWSLETLLHLQDFILSKWEIFLQYKMCMILQPGQPTKHTDVGKQLEGTQVFV